MRIITISREFGSGGRELGKRLADMMGIDYYDSEIISAVAKSGEMGHQNVEEQLSNHGWQSFPIAFRGTIGSSGYMQANKIDMLLKQKEVIEKIASIGEDFVIVGRNADVILREFNPFNLFVCATTEAKVKRCMERMSEEENLTEKELIRKMKQIDKMRSKTREIISGSELGQRDAYHLTINTSGWDIKDIVPAVSAYADCWFGRS